MKKVLNILLICSLITAISSPALAKSKKEKKQEEEKIEIVKPEKEKVNRRLEWKKFKSNEKAKKDSSKEAKGMYETKFPTITSQIEYADMNGEVTLSLPSPIIRQLCQLSATPRFIKQESVRHGLIISRPSARE